MITFKQFLMEDDASAVTPIEAVKYVVEHCQDFLKETRFHISHNASFAAIASPLLYRGLGGFSRTQGYVLSGSRTRTPIDSSHEMTETLDTYFTKHYNFPYRKQGVFCSGSEGSAFNYGNAFIIFPTDNYNSVWSNEIEDAYTAFDWSKGGEVPNMARHICADMGVDNPFESDEISPAYQRHIWYEILYAWLEKHHPYTDGDLLQGMASKVKPEIMLRCKEYVAIPTGNRYCHEFVEQMLELMA
jgi:hypothetical protein